MAAIDFSRSAHSSSAIARGFAALNALFGAIVHWNEARQTRRALNALTDRELDDIGLVRGDIDIVVR
ncbi:MAG: DUF1127 domain-containing protein [Pseudomonadota bacterium]